MCWIDVQTMGMEIDALSRPITRGETIGIYIYLAVLTIVSLVILYAIYSTNKTITRLASFGSDEDSTSTSLSTLIGPQGPKGDKGLRGSLNSFLARIEFGEHGNVVPVTFPKALLENIDVIITDNEHSVPPVGSIVLVMTGKTSSSTINKYTVTIKNTTGLSVGLVSREIYTGSLEQAIHYSWPVIAKGDVVVSPIVNELMTNLTIQKQISGNFASYLRLEMWVVEATGQE